MVKGPNIPGDGAVFHPVLRITRPIGKSRHEGLILEVSIAHKIEVVVKGGRPDCMSRGMHVLANDDVIRLRTGQRPGD